MTCVLCILIINIFVLSLLLTSLILLRARCLVPQLYYFFDVTTFSSFVEYRIGDPEQDNTISFETDRGVKYVK